MIAINIIRVWRERRRAPQQERETTKLPSKPPPRETPSSKPSFDLVAMQGKVIQRIEDTGIQTKCQGLLEAPTTASNISKFFVLAFMDQVDRNTRLNWAHATDAFHIKALLGVTQHDEKSYHDRRAIEQKTTEELLRTSGGGRMGMRLNANLLLATLLGLSVFAYFYTNPGAARVLSEAIQKYMLHIIVSVTLLTGLVLYLALKRRRIEK